MESATDSRLPNVVVPDLCSGPLFHLRHCRDHHVEAARTMPGGIPGPNHALDNNEFNEPSNFLKEWAGFWMAAGPNHVDRNEPSNFQWIINGWFITIKCYKWMVYEPFTVITHQFSWIPPSLRGATMLLQSASALFKATGQLIQL